MRLKEEVSESRYRVVYIHIAFIVIELMDECKGYMTLPPPSWRVSYLCMEASIDSSVCISVSILCYGLFFKY